MGEMCAVPFRDLISGGTARVTLADVPILLQKRLDDAAARATAWRSRRYKIPWHAQWTTNASPSIR